jgi:RNA polymerase sigma factor (sigma-70 family)
MSATGLATLVARSRSLCLRCPQEGDAELLQRFARQRDATAFEQLLERHAALVWGTCRRILPCEADCEDAFQATFLALVRQAGTLGPQRPLGGWLHTVAVRIARKARARSLRQSSWAVPPDRPAPKDVADDIGSRELLAAVDEEIERLPATLRMPVVLCCLEGRTRDEAADAMGCSLAAVKGRLERGRAVLRRRLERRGIQLPAAFLVLSLTSTRTSMALRARAIQAALGSATSAVTALAAAGTPHSGKLALITLSLLAAGVIGLGGLQPTGLFSAEGPSAQAQDGPSGTAPPRPAVADAPAPGRDRFGDPLPEGAVRRFGTLRFRQPNVLELAFTPDSKELIAGVGREPLGVFDARTGRKLREVGKTSPNNNYGFALSPDGKTIACCDANLTLWDRETGKLVHELGCRRCQAVAFSPDGARVAGVLEMQEQLFLFDTATGRRLGSWAVGDGKGGNYLVSTLAFSPDGKYVGGLVSELREVHPFSLTAVSTQVRLWDAEKGTLAGTFGTPDDTPHGFAFQPGTGQVAILGKDSTLRFWAPGTQKDLHRIALAAKKDAAYMGVRFSADGQRCAIYDRDGVLTFLKAKDGKVVRRIDTGKAGAPPMALALSPDGSAVALAKLSPDACVRVWDVESGVERLADAGHRSPATLSLSTDGRTLVSRGEDGRVIHWDLRTGEGRTQTDQAPEAAPRHSWSASGWVLRGSRWRLTFDYQTSEMKVWERDGPKLLRKVKGPSVMPGLTVSPDGSHLAFGDPGAGNAVMLWAPETEETPRLLPGHPALCQHLLFSHDGKQLIVGCGTHNANSAETIWIWDIATAKVVRKLATGSAPGHLLLSADDRILLAGGLWNDAAVGVWDLETGKALATLASPSLKVTSEELGKVEWHLAIVGLALSADERFVAVVTGHGDSSSVSIWETATWKLVRELPPIRPRTQAHSLVFSRDGRSLFIANKDTTILEWDVSGHAGRKVEALMTGRLDALWQALREAPDKAYPAAWEMLDHRNEAVRFLQAKLVPLKPVEAKRVRELLDRLDADSFEEREEANRQLLALGEGAVPALRRALEDKVSPEAKRRLEGILAQLTAGPSLEQQRLLRALAVLEWSGLAEVDEVLQRLAAGDPAMRLTQAAKAALQRCRALAGKEERSR